MIYLAIGHRTRIARYNAGTYHRSQALAMQRLDLHAMQNAGFELPPNNASFRPTDSRSFTAESGLPPKSPGEHRCRHISPCHLNLA
jgi:hypothetical protein